MTDSVDGSCANRGSDEFRANCVFCSDIDQALPKTVTSRIELCNYCGTGYNKRHYTAYRTKDERH